MCARLCLVGRKLWKRCGRGGDVGRCWCMPLVGQIVPSAQVGMAQDVKRARRAKDERRDDEVSAVKRGGDEAAISAANEVDAPEESHKVPANEAEESREDHAADVAGGVYSRPGAAGGGEAAARPKIDLEG